MTTKFKTFENCTIKEICDYCTLHHSCDICDLEEVCKNRVDFNEIYFTDSFKNILIPISEENSNN